ncbi:DNA transposition protein [Dongia sp.]|uniref:DNA transposition protein n=1 Tax=Dongia sp. TaxID=1977262 RepID=UPI0035B46525
MARQRNDGKTMDLLNWQPPATAAAFPAEKVRAATLRAKISKAVALSLHECGQDRDKIAAEMTAFLGEDCPKNMLDAYASEGREDHVINLIRFIGLAHATGDAQRLLQTFAEMFDLAVIPARYVAAIEEAIITDKIEELTQRQKLSRGRWKGARG